MPVTDSITLDNPVAEAVQAGLTAPQKFLPAWLFYDEEGSRLFERITTLPEYYLTRTERAIFIEQADNIVAAAIDRFHQAHPERTGTLRLLELGAGTASKTGVLLAAAVRAQGPTDYLPIDVSSSAIEQACASIASELPQVTVRPQIANYVTDVLDIPAHDGPTLALYIGSSIGNFSPAEAAAVLRNLHAQMRHGDSLLLGTDLVKDAGVLEAAYCDAEGVTAAFNLNLLRRLNFDLQSDFDLVAFRHVAYFNRAASRIEMHLRSTRHQAVHFPLLDRIVLFEENETIHTENSYKFTPESLANLLASGGFHVSQTYSDAQKYFAVTLASV